MCQGTHIWQIGDTPVMRKIDTNLAQSEWEEAAQSVITKIATPECPAQPKLWQHFSSAADMVRKAKESTKSEQRRANAIAGEWPWRALDAELREAVTRRNPAELKDEVHVWSGRTIG